MTLVADEFGACRNPDRIIVWNTAGEDAVWVESVAAPIVHGFAPAPISGIAEN